MGRIGAFSAPIVLPLNVRYVTALVDTKDIAN